jgi:SRSO17 transposase
MSKTERGLAEESEKRFVGFIDRIGRIIGKGTERLYDYCSALCLDVGERKSMEPIAATTAPDRVSAQHQSIHHFVSKSAWDDEREGTKETMRSRFAAVRVRAAHGNLDRDEEWLLVEWPLDKEEPERYWLSTLPRSTTMKKLVQTVQLRWRIERDFQELKSEFGLNHFEGRNWRGFHHHATLCIATYAFLAAERASFSPSARMAFAASCVPRDYRRRGTPHHRSKT